MQYVSRPHHYIGNRRQENNGLGRIGVSGQISRKRRRQPDQSSAGPSPLVSPYQTRIAVYEGRDRVDGDAALSAYGALYGKVHRKLFADVAAGRSAASLKNAYLQRYGIPARMFNGVRVSLEGKVASLRE